MEKIQLKMAPHLHRIPRRQVSLRVRARQQKLKIKVQQQELIQRKLAPIAAMRERQQLSKR
ncbi:MAG: hypothetical protein AB2L14_13475 [Candidatus Xenobiia bacterium LiM19]